MTVPATNQGDPVTPDIAPNLACALCGTNPARGFAAINGRRYCHAGESPTCYERAVTTPPESPDTPLCAPVAAVESASGATEPANARAAVAADELERRRCALERLYGQIITAQAECVRAREAYFDARRALTSLQAEYHRELSGTLLRLDMPPPLPPDDIA